MSATIPAEHRRVIGDILVSHFGLPGDFSAKRLGGLTNFNYCVEAAPAAPAPAAANAPASAAAEAANEPLRAVFRLPGEGTEDLVDRAVEGAITQAASDIGVDSTLLYFDTATGVKAVALIPNADTMSQQKLCEPENLTRAARVLRKLHDEGSPVDFRFDVFEMIPHYEQLIDENVQAEKEAIARGELSPEDTAGNAGAAIDWPGYAELRAAVMGLRERMQAAGTALCHCDPLCENFVLDAQSGRMYLIDWEYGGMNDPLWDVADVIIEVGYDREQRNAFQQAYFGRAATADEDERISVNIVLIDFLWSLWGKQRSYFDHTLDDYGPKRFERAQRNFRKLV